MSPDELMRGLPETSVRGRIRRFLIDNRALIGARVLEVGARRHNPIAWWTSAHDLAPPLCQWTGIDIQAGECVDLVADIESLPSEFDGCFDTIICSEVMEHVRDPSAAFLGMLKALKPGGHVIVTTLTAFPIHAYPNDFRRWTESGLRVDLFDHGFDVIETRAAGEIVFELNDHGEAGNVFLKCPIHVFATARKPY